MGVLTNLVKKSSQSSLPDTFTKHAHQHLLSSQKKHAEEQPSPPPPPDSDQTGDERPDGGGHDLPPSEARLGHGSRLPRGPCRPLRPPVPPERAVQQRKVQPGDRDVHASRGRDHGAAAADERGQVRDTGRDDDDPGGDHQAG